MARYMKINDSALRWLYDHGFAEADHEDRIRIIQYLKLVFKYKGDKDDLELLCDAEQDFAEAVANGIFDVKSSKDFDSGEDSNTALDDAVSIVCSLARKQKDISVLINAMQILVGCRS